MSRWGEPVTPGGCARRVAWLTVAVLLGIFVILLTAQVITS